MTDKQMAIVKGVHCGVGDRGRFALWFNVYISECVAALQVFQGGEEVARIVEAAGVGDVKELDGRPCWVECDGSLIRFKGWVLL